MAVITPKKNKIMTVPYEKLVALVKVSPEVNKNEFIQTKLKELGYNVGISQLENRMLHICNWIKDFDKPEKKEIKLDENEKSMIREMVDMIRKESDAQKIQSNSFEIIKRNGLQVGEGFKLIYNIILNSDRGPRLGQYIIERGKEEVIRKLKAVL